MELSGILRHFLGQFQVDTVGVKIIRFSNLKVSSEKRSIPFYFLASLMGRGSIVIVQEGKKKKLKFIISKCLKVPRVKITILEKICARPWRSSKSVNSRISQNLSVQFIQNLHGKTYLWSPHARQVILGHSKIWGG